MTGQVEAAPTLWTSHRRATVQRVGAALRRQAGWWIDLEGPFLLDDPLTLAELRERGADVLAAQHALSAVHGPIYAPFFGYGRSKRLRPTQFYLTKLPQAVFGLLPELAASGATPDAVAPVTPAVRDAATSTEVGVPWREPEATRRADNRRVTLVDPEILERGLRGHVETERALATALQQLGIEPMSPSSPTINYDLLWEHSGTLYVAEVKSTTLRNEELQLRRGLGQVVRYRRKLADTYGRRVIAVLVPERAPSDDDWHQACSDAAVLLLPRPDIERRLGDLLNAHKS